MPLNEKEESNILDLFERAANLLIENINDKYWIGCYNGVRETALVAGVSKDKIDEVVDNVLQNYRARRLNL